MKRSSNVALKLLAICSSLIVLSACATSNSVKSVDAMIDDGKRNTVLVSYNVTMNVTDKYSRVNSTDLVVHCGEPSRLGNVPECFRFNVPLQGRKSVDGYEYYSFSDTGSTLVQLPYGSFDVKSVRHNVIVGVEHYSQCARYRYRHRAPYLNAGIAYPYSHPYSHSYSRSRSRFFRHFDCFPVNVNVTARHYSETPEKNTIEIRPGDGCYAGHLKLEMNDGKITDYTLDQDAEMPTDEVLNSFPPEFQQAIKERGFSRCVAR